MAATLADHLGTRENRIDQIRLAAAVAVVFGHSWHLSLGPDAAAPLEPVLGLGVHELAVHVFFFLSGLLITQSAKRHADRPARFAFARFKRIFPALVAHALILPVALLAFGVVGFDQLGGLCVYSARLMTILFVEFTLPGAFAGNPFPEAINGSIWSLRHEVIVYALAGGAAVLGVFKSGLRAAAFLGAMLAWIITAHMIADQAHSGLAFIVAEGRWVMTSFLIGAASHFLARWIRLRLDLLAAFWSVAAAGLLFAPPMFATHLVLAAICYTTLIAAFLGRPAGGMSSDISYGVYIYGWPVQQLVVTGWIALTGTAPDPITLFAAAIAPLAAIASLSWRLIERPALHLTLPGHHRDKRRKRQSATQI